MLTLSSDHRSQELVFSGELDGVADDEPADEPTVGGDIQCFEGGLSVGRPSLPVSLLFASRLVVLLCRARRFRRRALTAVAPAPPTRTDT